MTNNAITTQFLHYNRWANLRLLEACSQLSAEQLAWDLPGAYGSIYKTLAHIIQAEARYYFRLTGVRLEPPFAWEAAPSVAEMQVYAGQVGSALLEIGGQMQITDALRRDWEDADWEGWPAQYKSVGLLIQVLNHGVEHRTNVTTILAQHGLPAPDLDGWGYMHANPEQMGA